MLERLFQHIRQEKNNRDTKALNFEGFISFYKDMLKKNTKGDFYLSEQGFRIFTQKYHLKRGYCCKSACKHCPYGYDKNTDCFM